MTDGRVTTGPGYLKVVRNHAEQAIAFATDSAPHRAREGERRWSIASALPAARILIEQPAVDAAASLVELAKGLAETVADESGKITDGFGHTRPSYALFAIHLLGSAARLIDHREALEHTGQAVTTLLNQLPADSQPTDPRLAAWRRLIARQHGFEEAEDLPLPSTDPAPLVPLGLNDLIDSWTYYELVGLHGMHLCSELEKDELLAQRTRSAAEYHLGHTQPDYTTYQPWGLAAFASNPQTAVFAEQQLHDVATHLSIEGPGGAVMPALLLADAAATMAGRLSSAWAEP
jgi:hypothetical protein